MHKVGAKRDRSASLHYLATIKLQNYLCMTHRGSRIRFLDLGRVVMI